MKTWISWWRLLICGYCGGFLAFGLVSIMPPVSDAVYLGVSMLVGLVTGVLLSPWVIRKEPERAP